ncbi:RNA polymerase III transcription factor IIIC subunit-domain-containing protein [Suillus discolor]|uniref:RNA polymerase III transcription factor IIIC subunit-domain-containing protein n=1 Tax=Suillus discolor TaxID=1912936 RepID=A0A9P7FKM7_9AGAM|nr:RNA polymerase III transcription factor IIIC subunit-domain-containing protein [Suillus discolor]KAG2118940.1 RNA polymerase III transcription factor IIIC subunit-domain-containing protein [Suillus discolor]
MSDEAGPSSTIRSEAPERPLPSTPFYSIEYPGYVKPESVPLAVSNLGGHSRLETAFKRTAAKNEALLELNLRPGNPFAHPIPGDIVSTNNILLKVVRRKRRNPNGECVGEFTAEAVGVIPKTARFRSMADYQFQPDMNDPLAQLRLAMDRMDVDAIRQYSIPEEKEDYVIPASIHPPELDPALAEQSEQTSGPRSNLRLFPPPLFSRQNVPQNYNFKANPASIVTSLINEETGEERKRLINKGRWKGHGPVTITFSDPNVPEGPPPTVETGRTQANSELLNRILEFMNERPVWTRAALYNQFSPAELREIHNSKVIMPLAGYMFSDGPWRDAMVRFKYDPRKELDARIYQRIYFRNANHPMARPSVVARRQEGRSSTTYISRSIEQEESFEADRRKSHIFDGKTVTKETAAFQLCDIHDPMLKEMVEDDEDLREVCDERDGWYSAQALERIKTILRHKFFSLLQGYVATEEECQALLEQDASGKSQTTRMKRLKFGKHNMAKGALRPEDAAAARLQATLDRNAKTLLATRREMYGGRNSQTADNSR